MNFIQRFLPSNILKQSIPTLYRAFSSGNGNGAKCLVVGIYHKEGDNEEVCTELSPGAYKVDEDSGGKLAKALNGLRQDIGNLGKVTLLSNVSEDYAAVAVAGLGKKEAEFNQAEYLDEAAENVRIATGVAARELQTFGVTQVEVEDFNKPEAAAEGSVLGMWHYSDQPVETQVKRFIADDGSSAQERREADEEFIRGVEKAESQNIVRCLCETPSNFITPTKFAERARDLLCPYGVMVNARDLRWLKEHSMTALLTVGSSSVEPPVFLELHYCSDDPKVEPYVMIGQGTTFNSGGLCRKECSKMMEADFAGAATILGVFKTVAAMRLPINLRAYIPLYEHMLGGLSLKPMDVIETHGYVIQTPHTRNFHAMTLGEAALHCVTSARLRPSHIFTLGTLSPGNAAWLGGTSGVFARCENTWQHINYAGAVTGDRMWRLPLFKDYAAQVTESKAVDIMNLGIGDHGEPCLIAAVLNKMTPACHDFSYIDITGSSAIANGYVPYLAEGLFTGAPTRGLVQLLCHLDYCKKQTANHTRTSSSGSSSGESSSDERSAARACG